MRIVNFLDGAEKYSSLRGGCKPTRQSTLTALGAGKIASLALAMTERECGMMDYKKYDAGYHVAQDGITALGTGKIASSLRSSQ